MRIPMESSFLIKRNYDLVVVVIVVDISRVRFVIVLDASDDRAANDAETKNNLQKQKMHNARKSCEAKVHYL